MIGWIKEIGESSDGTIYIAYAQWPDKVTWQNSGGKLPDEANEHRVKMKSSCIEITTIHELEMTDDLLEQRLF